MVSPIHLPFQSSPILPLQSSPILGYDGFPRRSLFCIILNSLIIESMIKESH